VKPAPRGAPWAYRKGNTPLHRAPGGVKLAGLLSLSLGAFLPGLKAFPVLALLLAALALAGGLKPWELLRGSRPLLLFALLVVLVKALEFPPPGTQGPPLALNLRGLEEGLVFGLRIAFAFAAGALFFALTTVGEIKRSLSRLESLLRLERFKLSLLLSLMLMFLPRCFETWEDAERAWKSRAGRRGLKTLTGLLPLVLEKMIQLAAETSAAMESRGA
jgi:biotin transport system permease protein